MKKKSSDHVNVSTFIGALFRQVKLSIQIQVTTLKNLKFLGVHYFVAKVFYLIYRW